MVRYSHKSIIFVFSSRFTLINDKNIFMNQYVLNEVNNTFYTFYFRELEKFEIFVRLVFSLFL